MGYKTSKNITKNLIWELPLDKIEKINYQGSTNFSLSTFHHTPLPRENDKGQTMTNSPFNLQVTEELGLL